MSLQYARPKGTNDFYGKTMCAWDFMEKEIKNICADFGISELRTPMFEQTDLFIRGIGDTTDIVTKEMYSFTDAGGRSFTLRPEGTANAARAYIENGVSNDIQPVKWFYISPAFRAERPQKGRYRQFMQFGVEYFGSFSASADAEVISVFYELLNRLGIKNTELHINSLGGNKCRAKYNDILKNYISGHLGDICPTCMERFEKNPLRILDCKSEGCKNVVKNAPSSVECLDAECAGHFKSVCNYLDDMGIPFIIDPLIVRGLDYYTKTVFEFVSKDLGAQATVCGGGRYDNLVLECGGAQTGAVGFGVGLERLMIIMEGQNVLPPLGKTTFVYIGSSGSEGDALARKITFNLRKQCIAAECDIVGRSVKAQLRYASKIGAVYVAIIGSNEISSNEIKLKNMLNGKEFVFPLDTIEKWLIDNID